MGFVRLILAIAVVGAHAKYRFLVDGRTAVMIFYMMSGFLMALILNTSYRSNVKGFYANRAFRLLIPYWIVLAIALVTYRGLGVDHRLFELGDPRVASLAWFSNVSIVGSDLLWLLGLDPAGELIYAPYLGRQSNDATLGNLSIVGPIFTVAIEMYFYAIAPFVVRSVRRSWWFLSLSILYHVVITSTGRDDLATTYHFFGSAFAYFGFGIIVCHLSVLRKGELAQRSYLGLALALAVFASCEKVLDTAMLLFALAALPVLFAVSRTSRLDRYVGNYSYLVYLIHFPVVVVGRHVGVLREDLFLLALVVSILTAAAIHHLAEPRLDAVRDRVRRGEGWRSPRPRKASAAS